ncbi:murein biosynthesis integral membrane protein MurJ, partial [Cellulomonas bogoriensis]|uniref:murein biosynthesis integral membrane protein MurJ n=1 Tax=Cellulomonas bogoriensis TaxID=301388 RepID=UPI001E352DD0
MSADAGSSRGLGRSTVVMAAGTATSRVLGVARATVLAAAIGLNVGAADAFGLANWLPNMIYMLIAGGVLNAVLVPQVVRAYRSDQGQVFVDRLLTVAGVILLGVSVLVTAAAPLVVRLATDSSDPDFIRLSTTFAFWCLPQIFFYGVYALLGQVLNAKGVFGPYMWAPVVNNVVAIAGLAAFIGVYGSYDEGAPLAFGGWDVPQVTLLAGTATLGVATQALVLVVPLYRSGFRYRPRLGWRDAGLGSAGRVAGWTFAALVVGQLSILMVVRVTSSVRDAGGAGLELAGNNAYNYAFLIFMLPHSLVTVSLLTALFTRLSGHAADGDVDGVRADTSYGLRVMGVFTVLATAVLMVLAVPVSRLVVLTVTPEEVSALAAVVLALLAGLVALGVWSLVQRVHYAFEAARDLFWLQVPMALVVAGGTLAGSWLLAPRWWTVAAGASIAASYVLGAVRGILAVRRRLGPLGGGVVGVHLRAALAALAASAVGWPLGLLLGDVAASPGRALAACVVVAPVMVVVYVAMLRLLGVRELDDLLAPLLRRLGRTMRTPGDQGPEPPPGGGSGPGGDRLDGMVIGRGTSLAGRYRLVDPVESDLPGAQCWTAHDDILDRTVRAVVLREGRVAEAMDAARRASLVSDPRLLRVLDVGRHEGVPYVVTEPLAGRDLAELTEHGPLPADQARAIVGEAAVALEVARRRGVHHLALRPTSVTVTDDGSVVVNGLALDGELRGEVPTDALATTRTDTVGLVRLLYLTLTGRWPESPSEDPGATSAPVVLGAPVAPAELSPGVPNDLDTLCAVTLGPHDDGPHTPGELVRELEPWAEIAAPELFGALDAASQWRAAITEHQVTGEDTWAPEGHESAFESPAAPPDQTTEDGSDPVPEKDLADKDAAETDAVGTDPADTDPADRGPSAKATDASGAARPDPSLTEEELDARSVVPAYVQRQSVRTTAPVTSTAPNPATPPPAPP